MGLKFIQFMKNRSLHHAIKCSPCEAVFGTRAKTGLKSTSLPGSIINKLKSDEDLETALSSIYLYGPPLKMKKYPLKTSILTKTQLMLYNQDRIKLLEREMNRYII